MHVATSRTPAVSARGVRVRAAHSAISPGTEEAQRTGQFSWWRKPDRCPGYSHVGRVESVGELVDEVATGDIIYSQANHASLVNVDLDRDIWAPLPVGVDPVSATLTTILAISLYGIRQADELLGRPVLVIGDGVIGAGACLWARLFNAGPVTLLGHHMNRLAAASQISGGEIETIDITSISSESLVRGTGQWPLVLLATPDPEAFRTAVTLCRPGGCLVVLATLCRLPSDSWQAQSKGLRVVFTHQPLNHRSSQLSHRRFILDLMASKRIDVSPLITDRVAYEQAAGAYQKLSQEKDQNMCAVLDWTHAEDASD